MKMRPPKLKASYEYLSPSPTLPYTIKRKKVFATQKPLRVMKFLRVLLGFSLGFTVIGSSLSFFSNRFLLRVLSDRILFESSVIGCSSWFSIIDHSLGSSVLFFQNDAIFYQNVPLFFLLKTDALLFILFSERTSQLRISSEKNEEILALNVILKMSWISRLMNDL